MDVFCTFKIETESQNLEYSVSKTSDHIQIKIKMANHNQEPLLSSKAPDKDYMDMYVFAPSK